MRGFRPSYFQAPSDVDEDREKMKEENLVLYRERVQAGLPVFDDDTSFRQRGFISNIGQLPAI